MRQASPKLMALLGVAAVIFIVVAGINLYGKGKITSAESWMPARVITAEAVESTAIVVLVDVQPSTFEECVAEGYVAIGVDPLVSDVRVDFLVESAGSEAAAERLIAETWCGALLGEGEGGLAEWFNKIVPGDYSDNQISGWFSLIQSHRDVKVRNYMSGWDRSSPKRLNYHVMTEFDGSVRTQRRGQNSIVPH